MRQTLLRAFALLAGAVAAGLANVRPAAARQTFTPSGGSYTSGSQLGVTIEFCSGPEQYYLSHAITFNGQDATLQFTQGGAVSWCTQPFQMKFTGSVTLAYGTNTLDAGYTAYFFDGADVYYETQYSNGTTYTGAAPPPPVVVPGGGAVAHPGTSTGTFRITASHGGTHSFTPSCTGVAGSCVASPISRVLAAGAVTDVAVTFVVGGQPLDTGRVALTASNVTSAQASFPVRVAPADPVIARDRCLRISAGPAASNECGDLRVVHALPSVQTMGRIRTPLLTYSSQNAVPWPIRHRMVTFTSGQTRPDSVRATYRLYGRSATRNWPGSQWPAGTTTRRVGVPLRADSVPTGIYADTLEIGFVTGCPACQYAVSVLDTGRTIIVNRSQSYLGNGWWLAGYERLDSLGDGSKLWIGGDGSARRYVSVGNNRFIAAPVAAPDTLLLFPADTGSRFIRLTQGGDSVVFNAAGLHVRTVNVQGHRTSFLHDGSSRLSQIRVPTASAYLTYTFTYGTDGRLATVVAPGLTAGSGRTTTFTRDAGRITYIQDPGFSATERVRFGYNIAAVSNRLNSRYDRMGRRTWLLYNSQSSRMSSAKIALGPGDTILTTFRAADARGAAGPDNVATHPDSLMTTVDGPRTDVSDTVLFWHDAFGGVAKLRDPLSNVTTVAREEPRWPALPTRVLEPNGRITAATYDARGNIASVTDSSVFIGGLYATTRYEWHPATSALSRAVAPEGDSVVMTYDAAGRNRLWQEDASGSSSRVSFSFNAANQVIAVLSPLSSLRDSIIYDAGGNAIRTRTPLGFQTLLDRDSLGRVTRVRTPVDSAQTAWREDWTFFDAAGRDSVHDARGGGDTLRVVNFYNAESQLDSVQRWTRPDPASIGTITTRWSYDAVGRAYRETAPDAAFETRTFDLAGNLTRLITRRGDTLHMVYDGLNRLTQRIVPAVPYDTITRGLSSFALYSDDGNRTTLRFPLYASNPGYPDSGYVIAADTALFGYDAVGNLVRADNRDAQVHRGYFLTGQVRADTLVIRPVEGTDTLHHYVLAYTYDRNGRRATVTHPAQLAVGTAGVVTYRYDPVGRLDSVSDLQGHLFTFHYNPRGERVRLAFPGAVYDSLAYDADGRVTLNRVGNTGGTSSYRFPQAVLRHTTLRYADAGRVSAAVNPYGWADTMTATYTGLGQLAGSTYSSRPSMLDSSSRGGAAEAQALDALGNARTASRSIGLQVTPYVLNCAGTPRPCALSRSSSWSLSGPDTNAYDGSARLVRVRAQGGRADSMVYTAAGDLAFRWTAALPNAIGWTENRAYYYGADGQLRAEEYRGADADPNAGLERNYVPGWWELVFEEHRADALGRRVLSRVRRRCKTAPDGAIWPCGLAEVRRSVWDGAQLLWEIRMPDLPAYREQDTATASLTQTLYQNCCEGEHFDPNPWFGRVGYTHGAGLDRPLSVTRYAYRHHQLQTSPENLGPFTVVPHWTWRGQADYGLFADGRYWLCTGSPQPCVRPAWRHRVAGVAQTGAVRTDLAGGYSMVWLGSLVEDQETATGALYRRHRYLDPGTGRFTQEDPIGLAGGMNLYGFAQGDPVSNGDPFGLSADTVHWDFASDEQRAAHKRMMESDREYRERYSALDSDSRDYYVVGESEIPGGCITSGFGVKGDGGDWCGVPAALTASGLGAPLFNVTADMERVLGRSVSGGIVLLPASVPSGYANWGEILNHELLHLYGIPKSGAAYTHPNQVFCTIPGRCP